MTVTECRRIALSLPESSEAPHHELTSFRVGGKIFATVTPDQRHVHIFVDQEDVERMVAAKPENCERLFWGGKLAGLRVRISGADADDVRELMELAWKRKAPKSLVKALEIGAGAKSSNRGRHSS